MRGRANFLDCVFTSSWAKGFRMVRCFEGASEG